MTEVGHEKVGDLVVPVGDLFALLALNVEQGEAAFCALGSGRVGTCLTCFLLRCNPTGVRPTFARWEHGSFRTR